MVTSGSLKRKNYDGLVKDVISKKLRSSASLLNPILDPDVTSNNEKSDKDSEATIADYGTGAEVSGKYRAADAALAIKHRRAAVEPMETNDPEEAVKSHRIVKSSILGHDIDAIVMNQIDMGKRNCDVLQEKKMLVRRFWAEGTRFILHPPESGTELRERVRRDQRERGEEDHRRGSIQRTIDARTTIVQTNGCTTVTPYPFHM
ncbi:hypothetical protein F4677DRAFT_450899 [Hypoxylon crocopeplum]|nr:hypothetical protein F4677DRAFT_450899 [Hypoxylon crocopeplum]